MCGIAGVLSFNKSSFRVSESYLTRMRDAMSHRGPDGDVVCKFNRAFPAYGLDTAWLGRRLAARERRALERLADLPNVPAPLGDVVVNGKVLPNAVARRYVPGHPLGSGERVHPDFFPALRGLLAELHRRGIAYVDLHKRENILVGDDGRPYLIDFQISLTLPGWWPANSAPARWLLRLAQRGDDYHLGKHVARCRPDLCGGGTLQMFQG